MFAFFSFVASIVTIMAFVFAIAYAVRSGQKTAGSFRLVTKSLVNVTENLVKLDKRTADSFRLVTKSLVNVTENLVKLDRRLVKLNRRTDVNWVLRLLDKEQWSAYRGKIADIAIDSEPSYLKNRRTFELTDDGRALLDASIMKQIELRVEYLANKKLENGKNRFPAKKDIPCNEVLRALDLMDLSVKADKKGVSLETMLAVSNGYANEEKIR